MKLKQLRNDDNAVSPVIGVILMVAITVILAAVIATFVLGLGEQVSDTTPNANFAGDWESNESVGGEDDVVLTITHTSGPSIDLAALSITGDTDNVTLDKTAIDDDEISAGDDLSVRVAEGVGDGEQFLDRGDEIRLRWENDDGDTAVLRTFTSPRNYLTDTA